MSRIRGSIRFTESDLSYYRAILNTKRDEAIHWDESPTKQWLIQSIDDALKRIDDRTYGICLQNGLEIDTNLLHEMPWIKYGGSKSRSSIRRARVHRLDNAIQAAEDITTETRPIQFPKILEVAALIRPDEILNGSCCVPRTSGVYAWYIDWVPRILDTLDLFHVGQEHQWYLMYVGIAGISEGRTLFHRIVQNHLSSTSGTGSSFRQSIAALLWQTDQLALQYERRPGGDRSIWFGREGEQLLTDWIVHHARVCWVEQPTPLYMEYKLISDYGARLPLNDKKNPRNPFRERLRQIKKEMRSRFDQSNC